METTSLCNEKIDIRIADFMQNQTVATVCCLDEAGHPYCFSCFYAVDFNKQLLYFKTSATTHHAHLMRKKNLVSGTILPDTLNKLNIRGIQFSGEVLLEDHPLCVDASSKYHKKYPFALVMPGDVWTIQLTKIKMTDDRIAFGKKIHWQLN
jgi:uncharacterized protein